MTAAQLLSQAQNVLDNALAREAEMEWTKEKLQTANEDATGKGEVEEVGSAAAETGRPYTICQHELALPRLVLSTSFRLRFRVRCTRERI